MRSVLILDFDGTLFNTLPVYFKIKKGNVKREIDILALHREYLKARKSCLQKYGEEWEGFFLKIRKTFDSYLISESSYAVMMAYLKAFNLEKYFSGVYGSQFAKDEKRAKKINFLIKYKIYKSAYIISDNPSDIKIQHKELIRISAEQLHIGGILEFSKKLDSACNILFRDNQPNVGPHVL